MFQYLRIPEFGWTKGSTSEIANEVRSILARNPYVSKKKKKQVEQCLFLERDNHEISLGIHR